MTEDLHVHLEKGPYTLNWLKEFIDVGKKRGIREIGFSEHAYRFKEAKGLMKIKGSRLLAR